MSETRMTVRACALQLQGGATLTDVVKAVEQFCLKHGIDAHPMDENFGVDSQPLPPHGKVTFFAPDNRLELEANGLLSFSLQCSAQRGTRPAAVDGLVDAIEQLVQETGVIEVVDVEKTADLLDALTPLFLGVTPEARMKANLHYGLAQAQDWLVPFIGTHGLQSLKAVAGRLAGLDVAPGQDGCPFCGSHEVVGAQLDVKGDQVTQECTCSNCDAQWESQYQRVQCVRLD